MDFDRLRHLHILEMAEDDRDTTRQCYKVLEYHHDKGANDGNQHNCLVEWKNINKTQSWANFFALSLNDPTPIIAFARKNNVLHKMPFRHLVEYCKSKTDVEIARVQKF